MQLNTDGYTCDYLAEEIIAQQGQGYSLVCFNSQQINVNAHIRTQRVLTIYYHREYVIKGEPNRNLPKIGHEGYCYSSSGSKSQLGLLEVWEILSNSYSKSGATASFALLE